MTTKLYKGYEDSNLFARKGISISKTLIKNKFINRYRTKEKQKQNFIAGAVNNGISKDVAAGIFLKIEPFAEYGFNKSHAAAYAIISYQTAFLKTYYPKEFIAASMTMDISNQNKPVSYTHLTLPTICSV